MSDAQATQSSIQPVNAVDDTQGFKIFAGNLAYAVTDDSLKAFFDPIASDIVSSQVITRGTRSAGYGFVTVKTLAAAQRACELLDKKELLGRQVVVEIAKPPEQKDKERTEKRAKRRQGRARGKAPPGEVTEAEANGTADKSADREASPVEGEIKPKPKKKNTQKKKAKKPTSEGDASDPIPPPTEDEVKPTEASQRRKSPRQPIKEKKASRPAGEDPEGEPSTTVLFVANLGFNIDDAGLSALFTDAGIHVVSARVVRRRWGKPRKSKGYGFVDVGGAEEQKKAIAALQGKSIEGRELAVKIAVNTTHDGDDDAADTPVVNGASTPEVTVVAK